MPNLRHQVELRHVDPDNVSGDPLLVTSTFDRKGAPQQVLKTVSGGITNCGRGRGGRGGRGRGRGLCK